MSFVSLFTPRRQKIVPQSSLLLWEEVKGPIEWRCRPVRRFGSRRAQKQNKTKKKNKKKIGEFPWNFVCSPTKSGAFRREQKVILAV